MTALRMHGIQQDREREDWRHHQGLKAVALAFFKPAMRDPGTVAINVAIAMSVVNAMKPRDFADATKMMQSVCDKVLRDEFGPGYATMNNDAPIVLGTIADLRPRIKGRAKRMKIRATK